jgi:hypothetical protein
MTEPTVEPVRGYKIQWPNGGPPSIVLEDGGIVHELPSEDPPRTRPRYFAVAVFLFIVGYLFLLAHVESTRG